MGKDVVGHFGSLSAQWARLGLPLRPVDPVPALLRELIPLRARRMLILGVTPDYADLAPDVTAVDVSEQMIAQVWPGDTEHRRVVRADWRDMPFEAGRFDVVVGDGSLTLLPFPDGVDEVLAEVRRVLAPDGLAVFRCFMAPEAPLTNVELVEFAQSLRGHSVDALRWRCAVQAACLAQTNILSGDAWRVFEATFPDHQPLFEHNGWGEEDLRRVALYREGTMALNFPSEAQFQELVRRHFNSVEAHPSGDYPMAELCPFMVMQGSAKNVSKRQG